MIKSVTDTGENLTIYDNRVEQSIATTKAIDKFIQGTSTDAPAGEEYSPDL